VVLVLSVILRRRQLPILYGAGILVLLLGWKLHAVPKHQYSTDRHRTVS